MRRIRKGKPSVKLALLALIFLTLTITFGKLVSWISSLEQPFSKDILVKKNYSWDGQTSINLAIKAKEVNVLNYDPAKNQIVILKIPDNTYFDLPKQFGSWPVASIYGLGQEEKPSVGAELLKQSLSKLLGLPIDGYIDISTNREQPPLKDQILTFKANPIQIAFFLKEVKTDLTPLESLKLLWSLSKVRSDKVISLDIANSNITESKLLADSSRVLGVNTIELDIFVRDKMSDSLFAEESVPVAIFNATLHPLLAQDVSREITNLGGNVIYATNSDQLLAKSQVIFKKKSATAYKIAQIFAPECLKKECVSPDPKVLEGRGEISIILGEDFYTSFYTK